MDEDELASNFNVTRQNLNSSLIKLNKLEKVRENKKMQFLKIIMCFVGLILIFPTITLAAPIHLKCEIETVSIDHELGAELEKATGSNNEFYVKLDEESGKITHTSTGKTLTNSPQFNSDGFFSARTISYQNRIRISAGNFVVEIYEIDRSNLNVTMTTQFRVSGMEIKMRSKSGTCKITETKDNVI